MTLIFALFAVLMNSGRDDQRAVVVVLSGAASVVHGIVSFIADGGARATVLGLFNAASAMFIGVAGVYAGITQDPRVPVLFLGFAVLAGLSFQVLVTTLSGRSAPIAEVSTFPPMRSSRWAVRSGVIALLGLVFLERMVDSGGGWIEGAAVAATIVVSIGVLWRPEARLLSFGTLVVMAAFILYAGVFHSGAGRLRIVALACALVLLCTLRFQRRIIKWVIVAAIPIALIILAQQRLSLQESISVGASEGRTGLESMLVPIIVFGQMLLEQDLGLPLAWGSSLLTMPLALLPESWFPGAPLPFGYELVEIHSPERLGTGFSTAATVAAEGMYNFGVAGLIVFAALLAWLFRVLDRAFVRSAGKLGENRTAIVTMAFWVMFSGAVADLAWNGQHIFLLRTIQRLPLLIVLAVVARIDDAAAPNDETPSRRGHELTQVSSTPSNKHIVE